MKSRVNAIMSMFLLLTHSFSNAEPVPAREGNADFPASHRLLDSPESETGWQRVSPQGEEFSILSPVAPTLSKQGRDYTMSGTDEKILDHRSYGGYADGFNFYIESFKAARPKNILKVLKEKRYPLRVLEGEIKLNGYDAREYRLTYAHSYGKYFEIITKKHVYLIILASRGAKNTSVARFVSGLILGDNIREPATGQVLDVRDSPLYKSAITGETGPPQTPGKIYKPSEVTSKAAIVGRPEPTYTEEARQKQVMGTVVLRGVFAADGQVRDLRVMSGLEGGLTGKAIEAALSIRFFPAEKDGQPVSQYIQIEYNFNLY
jgi:TonB family protein